MKKRILTFLLCVCMIASLLPVIATAEEAAPASTASLKISTAVASVKNSWAPTLSAGMATAYARTDADGNVLSDGTAADWNLKVEWPADGVPTLTMKDAKLVNDVRENAYHTMRITGSDHFKIELIGSNAVYGQPTAASDDYRGGYGIYASNKGDLLFTSIEDGSLLIEQTVGSLIVREYGSLTFKNANVNFNSKNSYYGTHCIRMMYMSEEYADNTNVTIENSNITMHTYAPTSHGIALDYTSSDNVVGGTDLAYSANNTSDITIENSIVFMQRHKSNYNDSWMNFLNFGPDSKLTIKRSDVEISAVNYVFRYAPYLEDYASVQGGSWSLGSYKLTAGKPIADGGSTYSKFKVTHKCLAGEPVYEGKDCSTTKDKVTYCVVCGKETSREPGFTVTPDKAHTPGTPVENVSLRKTVAHDAATDSYPAGYYVMETHCDVCGELIETKNVPFEAGLFYMTTYGNTGGIGETATTKPQIVLNPGETLYYTTTQAQASADYPNSWYRAAGSADNWNIKLEYPVGGHPIMTLKGATIKNDAGIFYGLGKYICGAPLTVVVQEDSTVASRVLGEATGKYNTYNRALTFRTTADVTITGPGKLTVSSDNHSENAGNILAYGNLIFENANVELYTNPDVWPANNGIRTKSGNIVIKNTKLLIRCVDTTEDGSPTAYHAALRADADANGERGNITICDGSDVRIFASTYSTQSFVTAGQFTIQDSNVVFASTGKTYSALFSATSKPVLDFTKSYRVEASTLTGEYNAETGTYTPPAKGYVDFTTTTSALYYFAVQMTGEIEGTSVTLGSTLDVHFAFDKTIIGTDGYVEFVKNGETTKVSLADCEADENFYILTFPGVAAKEMKDTITVTVYDAAGNPVSEVYSDSIAAYAMRMLRGEKPKDHTDEQFAALKTLLVDMLNYGAEAQTFFGHNADQLVNADLTDDEKALASAEMKALTTEERATEGEGYLATSFILESDIAMLIALDKEVTGTGSYALVTFTDHYGNVTTQKKIAALDTETHTEFRFDGLAAADARYDVTWEIYTAEDAKIATVTDSLEKYIARCIDEYDWMAQIMIYADSAYAYWHFNA